MKALGIDLAREQAAQVGGQPEYRREAGDLLARINLLADRSQSILTGPGAIELANGGGCQLLALNLDKLCALITRDANLPNMLLVATIYRDDDTPAWRRTRAWSERRRLPIEPHIETKPSKQQAVATLRVNSLRRLTSACVALCA